MERVCRAGRGHMQAGLPVSGPGDPPADLGVTLGRPLTGQDGQGHGKRPPPHHVVCEVLGGAATGPSYKTPPPIAAPPRGRSAKLTLPLRKVITFSGLLERKPVSSSPGLVHLVI